jgi:hypothetical protein
VSTQEDAALEREFDVLMAKAGAKVPADRKAGIVAGYKDIKRMTLLLRQPRTEAGEPSNIYSLIGFARSKRPCAHHRLCMSYRLPKPAADCAPVRSRQWH